MCLRFNERREENILIRLNQRKVKVIFVKFLIRHRERRLKYDL